MIRALPIDCLGDLSTVMRRYLETGTWAQRRDTLALWLGLHGLRIGEVVALRAVDLDICAHAVDVRTLKNGRHRTVPIHHTLTDSILAWREDSECRWLLYSSTGHQLHPSQLRKWARQVTRIAYRQPYRFHSLRHTCALRLLTATGDLRIVQHHLGHRRLDTTAQYVPLLTSSRDAARFSLAPEKSRL